MAEHKSGRRLKGYSMSQFNEKIRDQKLEVNMSLTIDQ